MSIFSSLFHRSPANAGCKLSGETRKDQKIIVIEQLREEKGDIIERESNLLCGETLIKIRLRLEKRGQDAVDLTCELIGKDGEDLPAEMIASKSLRLRNSPNKEEMEYHMEYLVRMALEAVGIPVVSLVLVSERYAEAHRELTELRKCLRKGEKR